MANFETQILESEKQVRAAQEKITAITSVIESARIKADQGIVLDVENATLEDVHKHTDVMNANIAELIMGLDDVTAGFSKDFDEMRSKTGWESFVGIFSSGKSESLRQERLRGASIDDKLQDLISKSDVIVKLLQGQLELLNGQRGQHLGVTQLKLPQAYRSVRRRHNRRDGIGVALNAKRSGHHRTDSGTARPRHRHAKRRGCDGYLLAYFFPVHISPRVS